MARLVHPVAVVIALALSAASASAQANALWYIGTYSNDILVWDESTESVVDTIRTRHFIPMDVEPNASLNRLYVTDASMQNVEIVDLATRSVVDEFTLSEGRVVVRISGLAVRPDDEKAVVFAKRYTRLRDRYVVEGPWLLEYDLRAKQVTDTIPWPGGHERDRVGFRYSPDGGTLYLFAEDIIALDAESFEETRRWKISEPLEPGLGRPSFGTAPNTYDDPATATSIFRMTDPIQNRRMMGIAQVRLAENEVDFFTLGDAQPMRGFTVAPGGEKAYSFLSDVGRYEFWEFDLVNRTVSRRHPFPGRPRMGIQASADGKRLFVYVAGSTIDVYDRATFEYLRTVTFDQDMTGGAVIPTGVGSGS
ncbi:MAG: hypothetical protein OEZ65_03915 [Gemmatimonadota bacterium]|nr:hypothetical protein [Gemmatimonadota bacterium]MDH5758710.1 hypothetical protein [Gemmatimonadota bacterium]